MNKNVKVAVIGAGTAGLYALSQVKKQTDDFVIINSGYYGTTCARVGCMPSKSLIQIAEYYDSKKHFAKSGISNGESLEVCIPDVLKRVRKQRDLLVEHNIKLSISRLGEKSIAGKAEFIDKNTLKVGEDTIRAEKIVIATGSSPVVNPAWEEFSEYLLTTDELFEQEDLPQSMAVVGLGLIGLELGQALAKLGINITAIHSREYIGGISDPDVNEFMIKECANYFDIWTGARAELSKEGSQIKVKSGEKEVLVDKILVATGRKPNIEGLKLENLGVELNEKGMPKFNQNTMQIEDLPVFIAGDVDAEKVLFHEAADEGRIAGYNTVKPLQDFQRKVPFSIVFSDPNIAYVGKDYNEIKDDENVIMGSFDFYKQSRAMVMNENKGVLKIYAHKSDGKILGAQMAVPHAEHLAYNLSWAIEQNLSVYDMLELPFYHPTLEEGIYMALLNCMKKLGRKVDGIIEVACK